jgi:adenylosuccinate lyase
LAEAAYILLAASGEIDAHEKIRLATLACERNKTTLREELAKDPSLWNRLEKSLASSLETDAETFFSRPELYRGKAPEKARKIARRYKQIVKDFQEEV